MNKVKEQAKVDAIKYKLSEGQKGNPLNKVKRVYNNYVTCSKCKSSRVLSNITYAYLCGKCGKCNNVEEANERFEAGEQNFPKSSQSKLSLPAFKTMDEGKQEYRMLRDESEIRSEMFVDGKTRTSMGVDAFNRELKTELVKNNAYRGAKTGIA